MCEAMVARLGHPRWKKPASENKPIADTVTAVRDAGSAIRDAHMIEKNRMQFFREVMNFLNEFDPLALN